MKDTVIEKGGQVLVGPFSSKDLPDYQAAIQHLRVHWRRFLSTTQLEIVEAILDRTARFGKRSKRIPTAWFHEGHSPSYESGYAGVAPITPISRQSFSKAINSLIRLGIVKRSKNLFYTLDYSINAMHLAVDTDVQKRVIAENKRGGMLSTLEGILKWAAKLVAQWVKPLNNKDGRASTYTFTSNKTQDTKAKALDNTGKVFIQKVREYFMGKRSVDDILADVTAITNKARSDLTAKRRARRTLPDLCNLFEKAWASGQKKKGKFIPVSRIVHRDRKLLKDRIIIPFREASFDIEGFAYWVSKHWSAIGAQYFSKSKKYPERPTFRWLVVCLDTYVTAYSQKDYLDTSGSLSTTDLRKKASKVDALSIKSEKVVKSYEQDLADLRAQLAEQQKENTSLREELGLEAEDDPVYASIIKAVDPTATIGSYDKPSIKPRPKKLRR